MLELVRHHNSVMTLRSPLLWRLGIPHGFSTRVGGVSSPPFDTLNLGSLSKTAKPSKEHPKAPSETHPEALPEDHNTNVAENFRRLRDSLSLKQRIRVTAHQVHGCHVHVVKGSIKDIAKPREADALITKQKSAMLTIRTADCLPILLGGPKGRIVAAIHAGWRGIVAGVIPRTLGTLAEHFELQPSVISAAIGPGIGPDHFEVGPEVCEQFREVNLSQCIIASDTSKDHIDLPRAALAQLTEHGVARENVDTTTLCTFAEADLFFSYRRDGQLAGRMATVIAPSAR